MCVSEEGSSSKRSRSNRIDISLTDPAGLERSFGVDDLAKENSKEWLQVFWDVRLCSCAILCMRCRSKIQASCTMRTLNLAAGRLASTKRCVMILQHSLFYSDAHARSMQRMLFELRVPTAAIYDTIMHGIVEGVQSQTIAVCAAQCIKLPY